MKHSKRIAMCMILLILTILMGGCGVFNKEGNKETQIKKVLKKH